MALAWHLRRADAAEARLARKALERVSREGALVPPLWYAEVANALLMAERNGAIDAYGASQFQDDLTQLGIEADAFPQSHSARNVLSLGRASKLTAYDATYLELALRTGSAFATFDRRLGDAARKAGIRVIGQ